MISLLITIFLLLWTFVQSDIDSQLPLNGTDEAVLVDHFKIFKDLIPNKDDAAKLSIIRDMINNSLQDISTNSTELSSSINLDHEPQNLSGEIITSSTEVVVPTMVNEALTTITTIIPTVITVPTKTITLAPKESYHTIEITKTITETMSTANETSPIPVPPKTQTQSVQSDEVKRAYKYLELIVREIVASSLTVQQVNQPITSIPGSTATDKSTAKRRTITRTRTRTTKAASDFSEATDRPATKSSTQRVPSQPMTKSVDQDVTKVAARTLAVSKSSISIPIEPKQTLNPSSRTVEVAKTPIEMSTSTETFNSVTAEIPIEPTPLNTLVALRDKVSTSTKVKSQPLDISLTLNEETTQIIDPDATTVIPAINTPEIESNPSREHGNVRDIMNLNLASNKVSVGPQFQNHLPKPQPGVKYAKPKVPWYFVPENGNLNSNSQNEISNPKDASSIVTIPIIPTTLTIYPIPTVVTLPESLETMTSKNSDPNPNLDELKQQQDEDIIKYLKRIYPQMKEMIEPSLSTNTMTDNTFTTIEEIPELFTTGLNINNQDNEEYLYQYVIVDEPNGENNTSSQPNNNPSLNDISLLQNTKSVHSDPLNIQHVPKEINSPFKTFKSEKELDDSYKQQQSNKPIRTLLLVRKPDSFPTFAHTTDEISSQRFKTKHNRKNSTHQGFDIHNFFNFRSSGSRLNSHGCFIIFIFLSLI